MEQAENSYYGSYIGLKERKRMLSDRLDESPSVAAENITALTSQRQACKVQFICEELIVI